MFKFAISALFVLLVKYVDCQNFNVINNSEKIYDISGNSVCFEDKSGQLIFSNILNMPFHKANTVVPNFSISRSTFWIKFQLKNDTKKDDLIIEISHATLDSVTLYSTANDNELVDSILLTENKLFRYRPVVYQTYMFQANLSPGQQKTYFLKIKGSEQILVPISVGSTKEILNRAALRDLIFGLYIGIIVVMLLYNLFLSYAITNAGYFYYVIYIFFVGLTQAVLQGYSFRFLWPNTPSINNYAGVIVPMLNGLMAIEFVRHFLNLKVVSRAMDKGMRLLAILYVASLIPIIFKDYIFSQILLQIVASGGSLYLFIICVLLVLRKYKPAKILLIAWSIFLLCVMVFVLRNFGILPYNNFTFYALQIGSSIEAVLLSLALADKINIYRREESVARKEALRVSKENERLVTEQNIILENEVAARTFDLENANNDLNKTLNQLKLAQAKLVDSEKMASLGQLTAGVAHEINNPINFVTSNIKPLEMDIQDLFEVLDKYENVDPDNDIKPQLEKIDAFKKEIDIKYIGSEIKSLLSGIKDGATRTAEIVKNLKNFVRLDQTDLKLANLNEGINSTLVLVRNSFPKNMVLEQSLGDIPQVECSPGKINQVFMNIISNAVQATKSKEYKNGEIPSISIRSWSEADSVVKVSIRDNGIGMPADVIERIYEPFFTTKPVGEGTGLGMSIVKGIIDGHKGNLEIHSTEGIGTEFVITLPIVSLNQ